MMLKVLFRNKNKSFNALNCILLQLKAFLYIYKNDVKFSIPEALIPLLTQQKINYKDIILNEQESKNFDLVLNEDSLVIPFKKLENKIQESQVNITNDITSFINANYFSLFEPTQEGPKYHNYFLIAKSFIYFKNLYIAHIAYPKAKDLSDIKLSDLNYKKLWFAKSIFLTQPKTLYFNKSNIVDSPDKADYLVFFSDKIDYIIGSNYPEVYDEITLEIKKPILTIEGGFLNSIDLYKIKNSKEYTEKYTMPISFCISDIQHYDIRKHNLLERMLTTEFMPVNQELSKKFIKKLFNYKLSKYNNQIKTFVTRQYNYYALIIDQAYNDKSISLSNASGDTFKEMLEYAIKNTPENFEIWIKVHPEQITGRRQGYFTINDTILAGQVNLKPYLKDKRIKLFSEPINPISLVSNATVVYTVGSQLGFEALMYGCKEVHTFGVPFYSGYGLTIDHNISPILKFRNNYQHTVEDIFEVAYNRYCKYFIKRNNTYIKATLDEAIEYLHKLQNEWIFFQK